jgi:MFS family permease
VRFLQGTVCGLFGAVVPMLIKEISPHDIASISGSFANAAIIAGLFFLYLFGYLLKLATGDPTGGESWRVLFLFPILLIAMQTLILLRVFPFQTPKYLAHNNKTAELRQMMGEFYKIEHVEQMY